MANEIFLTLNNNNSTQLTVKHLNKCNNQLSNRTTYLLIMPFHHHNIISNVKKHMNHFKIVRFSQFNLQKYAGEDTEMPHTLSSMIRSGTSVVYAGQFF